MDDLITIPAILRAARDRLDPALWDYVSGGAESETTLRRNRSAFDELAFAPRILRDMSRIDTTTTLLGQPLALPVVLAPVGSIGHYDLAGALTCARAAAAAGTAAFVGSLSSPVLEDVRAGSTGPLFFQLYLSGDMAWVKGMARRVEDSGYAGLCLTVDSAAYGRRERDLHNRFVPMRDVPRPNLAGLPESAVRRTGERYEARFTWDALADLRASTRLPLMLKGILSADDARLAVEHGVEVVYVSNHGGRQLDHAPASIEVLTEIVAAVAGRAEIVVDSGFLRGTDILKAVALGARAVAIGKLMVYGLAAGGEAGLIRTLDILGREIRTTMANIGTATIADLTPAMVRPTRPPGARSE